MKDQIQVGIFVGMTRIWGSHYQNRRKKMAKNKRAGLYRNINLRFKGNIVIGKVNKSSSSSHCLGHIENTEEGYEKFPE